MSTALSRVVYAFHAFFVLVFYYIIYIIVLLYFFFFNDTATTEIYTLSLHDALPILSKYNVDDVALGVCKTGAEEAGVTEVRTSLSEKKFELWREIKV